MELLKKIQVQGKSYDFPKRGKFGFSYVKESSKELDILQTYLEVCDSEEWKTISYQVDPLSGLSSAEMVEFNPPEIQPYFITAWRSKHWKLEKVRGLIPRWAISPEKKEKYVNSLFWRVLYPLQCEWESTTREEDSVYLQGKYTEYEKILLELFASF